MPVRKPAGEEGRQVGRGTHGSAFRDVLPAFGNLDKRAEEAAEEYYNRIGSQPEWNNPDVDMAAAAEAAPTIPSAGTRR